MKAKLYISMMGMAVMLLFSSCVIDTLYRTLHPGYGQITVTADWTNRGAGVDIPASWTVSIGDYIGTETGETHTPDSLFEAGSYTLVVYNIPEGITVSGTTATVAADDANAGCISGTPGWFFTSVQEVTIEADNDYELIATMQQQVRQLTLVLEPTGDAANLIESIEGSLSGVAGTLDFATNSHRTSSEVALSFTKITEGNDAGKWSVTVRLLGIVNNNTQTLTATISYSGGTLQDSSLNSDLTTALEDFNTGKTTALTLGGTLEAPNEAGFTATIGDWETVGDEQVDLQ